MLERIRNAEAGGINWPAVAAITGIIIAATVVVGALVALGVIHTGGLLRRPRSTLPAAPTSPLPAAPTSPLPAAPTSPLPAAPVRRSAALRVRPVSVRDNNPGPLCCRRRMSPYWQIPTTHLMDARSLRWPMTRARDAFGSATIQERTLLCRQTTASKPGPGAPRPLLRNARNCWTPALRRRWELPSRDM